MRLKNATTLPSALGAAFARLALYPRTALPLSSAPGAGHVGAGGVILLLAHTHGVCTTLNLPHTMHVHIMRAYADRHSPRFFASPSPLHSQRGLKLPCGPPPNNDPLYLETPALLVRRVNIFTPPPQAVSRLARLAPLATPPSLLLSLVRPLLDRPHTFLKPSECDLDAGGRFGHAKRRARHKHSAALLFTGRRVWAACVNSVCARASSAPLSRTPRLPSPTRTALSCLCW